MKILSLAKLFNLDKVEQSCINLLKNMKLETLSETVHLQDLDKEEMQFYLTQRIERLEKFLDELYPQFMGLLASMIWLSHEAKKRVSWCTKHVSGGQLSRHATNLEIRKCSNCKGMLRSMVSETVFLAYDSVYAMPGVPKDEFKGHFDSNLFSIMEKFSKLQQS